MNAIARRFVVAALCLAVLPAARAGSIEVSYDPATAWTDAGTTPREEERHSKAVADALRGLAGRLPRPDMTLQVRLIDIDLAGTPLPVGPGGQMIRIVRGGADAPRLQLEYVLLDGGREMRRGRDTLTDPAFAWRHGSAAASDPLAPEKRLLSDWLENRLLGTGASP